MPFYVQRGRLPAKRHVAFRKESGAIHHEHLMGNLGFGGLQSLLYTLRRPTTVKHLEVAWTQPLMEETDPELRMRHLRTHRLDVAGGSAVKDRVPLLFNKDVALSLVRPRAVDDFSTATGKLMRLSTSPAVQVCWKASSAIWNTGREITWSFLGALSTG